MPFQTPASLPPGNRPYPLDIQVAGGLSASQVQVIQAGADRWRRAILSAVPPYVIGGVAIEGMVITAGASPLAAGVEGKTTGPDYRPMNLGWFPVTAAITFNATTLGQLEASGMLRYVAEHEIAHALGFGSALWTWKNLITQDAVGPLFNGADAMVEFGRLRGQGATAVPVENQGGAGVANIHWRDSIFGDELVSSYEPNTALSRVTLASLSDLGYVIDSSAGDAYALPRSNELALRLAAPSNLGPRHSHDTHWLRTPGRVLPEQPIEEGPRR